MSRAEAERIAPRPAATNGLHRRGTLRSGPRTVIVVGGGNAALCAALAARRAGADVMLLERAAPAWRGGNSKYTRNVRCVHGVDDVMPGIYTEEELEADLRGVTGDGSDPAITRFVIERSRDVPAWMEANGILWQPALRGTLQLGRTNRFFLGGGKALVNTYFRTAERIGVRIAYEQMVEDLRFDGGRCVSVRVLSPDGVQELEAGAVVVASGGFEANLAWLREYWGDAADKYLIRGSRQNDGLLLRRLLDQGAQARGNPRGFHAIAVDARSPRFEGGIVTRVDSIPFSVVLNREGRRFYDEGEDLWPKRYATWGGLIARQLGQEAYSFFDSAVRGRFISSVYPPYQSETVGGLAEQLGLPVETVERTIADYNAALATDTDWDPRRLDGLATTGLEPPKSNWALPIAKPPFYAYPLRPGITFTYLGVAVDTHARVLRQTGDAFDNVFAAGEVMAGNILLRGYLAGFGMTIGTVYGRLAGEQAAERVLR
jgi:tricarballylate dehydrogenase